MSTAGRVRRARTAGRLLVVAGSIAAGAATAHTWVNMRVWRVPSPEPPPTHQRVSVLLPLRDEARRVTACMRALLNSSGVDDLEVLVLDDGSSDGTADVVRAVAGADPRVQLLRGAPLPAGWLGKPHACHQLASAATGDVLVFLDADVVLAPPGIAATVDLLRRSGLDLVCPYPRQLAATPGERLVQPLLQWSFLTLLPLGAAERSSRPSTAVANGQLLAVSAAAYRRAGGHATVRAEVLDDVALLRAVVRAGGRGAVADGTWVATCRMYESWAQVRDGYAKSLWSAFGSPAGSAAVVAALLLAYVVPAAGAIAGSRVGALGYAAGVVGRVLVARRTGGRAWPDPLAHPVSIAAFAWLVALSWWRRARGTATWKGRTLAG